MSLKRLHFVVEGQTEEDFVKRVLVPHLSDFSVFGDVRCVMTSRRRGVTYRGGMTGYARAKKDVDLWRKEDPNLEAAFSTMFDLYALPRDFPEYSPASLIRNPYERVRVLEEALYKDINDRRFHPYLQMHEFETLIFADPRKLNCRYPERKEEIEKIAATTDKFQSPELINDDNNPCKRIVEHTPEYEGEKAFAGPLVVESIGLVLLREKCSHFGQWLSRLEGLGENSNDLRCSLCDRKCHLPK